MFRQIIAMPASSRKIALHLFIDPPGRRANRRRVPVAVSRDSSPSWSADDQVVIMAGEEGAQGGQHVGRLEADTVALGEAALAPTMTETTAGMVAAADHPDPRWQAAPRRRSPGGLPPWMAACTAIMRQGRDRDRAVRPRRPARPGAAHALLGQRRRSRASICAIGGGLHPAGDLRDARQKKEDGSIFKIKVGVDAAGRGTQRRTAPRRRRHATGPTPSGPST